MSKQYKVWIEIEEYNPVKDEYKSADEPVDIACKDKKAAEYLRDILYNYAQGIVLNRKLK